MDSPNVCYLDQVHIIPTLFTVYAIKHTLLKVWTDRHYVVYSMEPLSLRSLYDESIKIRCLQYGLINLTLLTQ